MEDERQLSEIEQMQCDVNRLQEMIDDFKCGEKVDLKLLVLEFQNLLKRARDFPETDDDTDSTRKTRQAKNLVESLEMLKTQMTSIQRNTDVGRANTVRDRLRKKLEDKKARKELEEKRAMEKQPKMKGPNVELVNEVLSTSRGKMKGPDLSQIM